MAYLTWFFFFHAKSRKCSVCFTRPACCSWDQAHFRCSGVTPRSWSGPHTRKGPAAHRRHAGTQPKLPENGERTGREDEKEAWKPCSLDPAAPYPPCRRACRCRRQTKPAEETTTATQGSLWMLGLTHLYLFGFL